MPKSKLSRVLFPDDFDDGNVILRKKKSFTASVDKNDVKKEGTSMSSFIKNDKRLIDEDSCLARLAGPDLPVAISPSSPSCSLKENESSVKQVQKRRRSKRNRTYNGEEQQQYQNQENEQLRSRKQYNNHNTRERNGGKNSKRESNAKHALRRTRRVSTEAMDVLVNIGNTALNNLPKVGSHRQGETKEKKEKIKEKKTQRQRKSNTKIKDNRCENKNNLYVPKRVSLDNGELTHCKKESPISQSITPKPSKLIDTTTRSENTIHYNEESSISPSIVQKPRKRIDTKETPIQNKHEDFQLHYDYEDNLDKIVWHGISSTIRKEKKSKSHSEKKIEKVIESTIEIKGNVSGNSNLHSKNEGRNNSNSSDLKNQNDDPRATRRSMRKKKPVDRLTIGHKSRKKKRIASTLSENKEKTDDKKKHQTVNNTCTKEKESLTIENLQNVTIAKSKNGDITPNCHTETSSTSATSKEIDWDDASLKLLKNAHKNTDPKSSSFWQQISSKVPLKSAEQCRDKWFALVNTPKVRRKKSQKHISTTTYDEEEDDDDIFNSTPNRNTAKILLQRLSSTSRKTRPQKASNDNFSDILSSPILKGSTSHFQNTEKIFSPLKFQPMYKSYLNKVRASLNERNRERKLVRPTKIKTSQKRPKYLSAEIDAGDVHMNGILSPNGTVMVDAPEEHEAEGMYLPSDYEFAQEDVM